MPPLISELGLHIRTKSDAIRPMRPWRMQLHYQQNRARRELNLKSRQLGFSTWKEVEALLLALLVPGFSGVIVSHERDQAKRLMSIVKIAHRYLPEEGRVALDHDTEEYLVTPHGSRLYIGTGRGRDFGRGDTIHWFHGSEVSRWSDPQGLLLGLELSVPKEGYICLETTANGREHFYDLYVGAVRGENEYKPHFYPWWWEEEGEYTAPLAGEFVPMEDELNVMQLARQQGFDLAPEQIAWRRRMVSKWKDKFQQEYPETWAAAFLTSGNPVFDYQLIDRLLLEAQTRPLMREAAVAGGRERVWLPEGTGHTYIVGVDPSRGLPWGDAAAAVKLDCDSGQHIASLTCRLPTHQFCERLVRFAGDNKPMLAVERNGPGEAILEVLNHVIRYPNLYRSVRWYDRERTDVLGWYTTRQAKERMCSEFARALECGDFRTWDLDLLDQAKNVLRDTNGDPYTVRGKDDHLLMAAMIANITADEAARNTQNKAEVLSYAASYT